MLNINPSTLASVVKLMKRHLVNHEWSAAIDLAADQLVTCEAISALSDKKLRFQPSKGKAFTATCHACENPKCRISACQHRMAAYVWARYREEERKQSLMTAIVYGSQMQLNPDCGITMTVEGRTVTLTAREVATLYAFAGFAGVIESIGATELLLEGQLGFHEDDE